MGIKAIISVASKQKDNENDAIEIVSKGNFYKKENCYYAVYEETELSGMAGTTTTIKIKPDELSLIRKGTTEARVNFKENKKDISMYNTPYGTLELLVQTKKVSIDVNDNGGKIEINYDMGLAGQKPLNTSLNIDIKTI
ncbi:putative beta-barrel protein YwiB [Clostridium homopropionicum DSM 5847]|uniref:Putative beta-barrel protein YwiB n=1 Tax=Clostridium homopropionicum DSM 5847 TaxID=1121318 RepID=A0A0L6Z5Y4_9CLOT|nr:DUF1934 domain-containing protein [Clostridium homopropionicum]KOA18380.1 putative beta-barrel protein YwiB [Clostridium homopropionicum DSM 5847]SFF68063.1 Uncharacterized beta-barrel protein YwiB, DUF1934 family [Clostridium homopropionicum]